MDDKTVFHHITALAKEEHAIWHKESQGEASDGDRERLREINVILDQCWDLLHQRQALRAAGRNPDDAQVRDAKTVEGYVR